MEIIELEIDKLKLRELNPRIATTEQIEHYKKILEKLGCVIPIIITSENEVLFDVAKFIAAKELGFETVKTVKIDDIPEDKIEALRLAELKAFELGEWDNEVVLKILENLDKELQGLTGFDFEELKSQFEKTEDVEIIQEIDTPEVEEEYFSKHGDIYLLGNHRLMCGDSTRKEDVEKLVDGNVIDLMITDPPYNVDYEGSDGQKIKNDNMSSNEFYNFLKKFYENAFSVMREGAAFYVFHADIKTRVFRDTCEEAGFKISQCLIWIKNNFSLSKYDYNWQHEPCLYGWKTGVSHYFNNAFTQYTCLEKIESLKLKSKKELIETTLKLQENLEGKTTLLKEDRPLKNDLHPTIKPLKLLGRLMINSSQKNWNVLDLFGGSGSTLMVAEQLERKAFLMEFDPKYTDVIVKRFTTVNQNIKLLRDGVEYSWEEIKENFGETNECN